jgi:hypothetical protein
VRNVIHVLRARQLRRYEFDRTEALSGAVKRLARGRAPSVYSTLWSDAVYGWGNEKWSADEMYLAEVIRTAERTSGSILECGSGLTTLLMSVVAARRGLQVHSLEHNETWHARVRQAVIEMGGTTTTVHLAPLRSYDDFDWYDAPLDELPSDISLVVCDGPPGSTRGGRSGMLPRMRGKLAPHCTVLLDDISRPAERELAQAWSRESGTVAQIKESKHGFARVAL